MSALPLLDSMMPGFAATAPLKSAKRMVCVYSPNGVALPSTNTLADVCRKLFEPDDGNSVAERRRATRAKTSLLDTVLDSANRLTKGPALPALAKNDGFFHTDRMM